MKNILLSENVVPIAEFKAKTALWLEKIRTIGNPIMITQNGKPAGILVSPIDYDRALEKDRFVESIRKGLTDADKGHMLSTEQLKKRLLK